MTTGIVAPLPARVAAVLATASTWTAGRRKSDGKPFFFIQGSTPGAVYMTAVDGCTCPAAQKSRTGDCKHQEAVRQYTVTAQPAPAPKRASYADLFPGCRDCGDLVDGYHDNRCRRCGEDAEWNARRDARAS